MSSRLLLHFDCGHGMSCRNQLHCWLDSMHELYSGYRKSIRRGFLCVLLHGILFSIRCVLLYSVSCGIVLHVIRHYWLCYRHFFASWLDHVKCLCQLSGGDIKNYFDNPIANHFFN